MEKKNKEPVKKPVEVGYDLAQDMMPKDQQEAATKMHKNRFTS